MSREYVEQRVREALKKAEGNPARARQVMIAWCHEDHKLLEAITKAHLNGIVAYNIERILSGRGKPKEKTAPPKPVVSENAFGKEVLRAVAINNGAQFGLEAYGETPARGKASQQHINALKLMAAKSKHNKK